MPRNPNRRPLLRELPNGESCEECDSKLFYLDDGHYFCQRGHRQESLREIGQEDEDEFGKQGPISRRQKEAAVKELRQLGGVQGKELYLECLQLLLRKQVWRLVRDKGCPAKLETVVMDLWYLRLRDFGGLPKAGEEFRHEKGKGKEKEKSKDGSNYSNRPSGSDSEEGSGLAFFSSQDEGDESSGGKAGDTKPRSKVQNWSSHRPEHWKIPRVLETLGLCYLGALLLRLPLRIGDLFRWAKWDQIPYLGAYDEMTPEMRDRLGSAYKSALMTRRTQLNEGDLQDGVMALVKSYHKNFGYSFPGLNIPPMLLKYLRELALPPEVYAGVDRLAKLLDLQFTFPKENKRSNLLDSPDTLLAACIALVVKVFYPFDGIQRVPARPTEPSVLLMDWEKWQSLVQPQSQARADEANPESLTDEDAWRATRATLDKYVDWFEAHHVKDTEGPRGLKQLFPLETQSKQPANPPPKEMTQEDTDRMVMDVMAHMKCVQPQPGGGEDTPRLGSHHEQYRAPEELHGPGKEFHERLANLAGLPLRDLLRAILALERRIKYI